MNCEKCPINGINALLKRPCPWYDECKKRKVNSIEDLMEFLKKLGVEL